MMYHAHIASHYGSTIELYMSYPILVVARYLAFVKRSAVVIHFVLPLMVPFTN